MMKTNTAVSLLMIFFWNATAQADVVVSFGSGANQSNMDFVTIGNPGNAADTTGSPNPAGSVGYVYNIGKYEVSRDMVTKANAEGGLGITLDRMLTSGPRPAMPATGISWNEAARFLNWLNTSNGFSPAYRFGSQPGEPNYDADANIELWQPGDAGYDATNLYRNRFAHYFLPSVDEWHKAAYYDPTADVYYDYPTGSDSVPDGIDFAGDTTFDAVFFDGGSNPQPNDITDVGVLSPYGTTGQGGNVWEWEETEFDLGNNFSSSARGSRGGNWGSESISLLSTFRSDVNPSDSFFSVGFRVASIPEPSTGLLGLLGLLGAVALLLRRRVAS